MSMTGAMAATACAVFLGLFAIKAGPAYFENWTVAKIVEEASADDDLMRSSRSKVLSQIDSQYRMNNLWDLRAEDTVVLRKDGQRGYAIDVAYEKRENLFSNIDLVMRFGEPVVEVEP